MRPGTHAAGDGSFGRSAGIQAGRAFLLIAVAVVIGFVLLHHAGGGTAGTIATGGSPTTSHNTGGGGTGGTTTTPRSTTTTAVALRAPEAVKVLVANATSTAGLAGRVTDTLHAKGYDTLTATDASNKPPSSVVYFEPGYGPDAASLAGKLDLPATAVQAMPVPPPVANLSGADILVDAGPDLVTTSATTPTT